MFSSLRRTEGSSRVIGCYCKLCARDIRVCARRSDVWCWNVLDGFASRTEGGSCRVIGRYSQLCARSGVGVFRGMASSKREGGSRRIQQHAL